MADLTPMDVEVAEEELLWAPAGEPGPSSVPALAPAQAPGPVPSTVDLARRMREDCLAITSSSGAGHIASALSLVDILAVLYGSVMHVNPADPKDPARDRFILSKGHGGSAVYAALAELGFIDRNDLLKNYYASGSVYSGHVSHAVPGVELSTGSLGQGLGVACGMALAARLDASGRRVFCVMGDGECDEGSVWEAALLASTLELDRLVAVVDRNGMQSFGPTDETALKLGDIAEKFRSFGWRAIDCDGHDHAALEAALTAPHGGQPLAVIAHTVKGKGVSFMEGDIRWHYDSASKDELRRALSEVAVEGMGFPAGTSLSASEGGAA